ncbi:hypothetical protein PM082_004546 [Marasmius tenuissimus]|nr:hypothetical protein PM082_004546 [Marasmius tenuissimus]
MGFVASAVGIAAYQRQNTSLYTRAQNILNVLVTITAVNVSLLTLLTAGRIWWTFRQVGQITGSRVNRKYTIFVATILESGILFSATEAITVFYPLITDPKHNGIIPFDSSVIAIQMAAIAPTPIIVQIAYGQAVESVQQMVSTLQFAEGAINPQQHSTVARGTVDLQHSLAEIEERGTVGRIEVSDKPPLDTNGPGAV